MKPQEKEPRVADSPSRDFLKDENFSALKALFENLQKQYGLSALELIHALEKKELLIPANIFNPTLSGLETIVKFLRENFHLRNNVIAHFLHRSEKTIWQAYDASKRKHPDFFTLQPSLYYVPVAVIASRRLSVLESIVVHIKDSYNLSYHEIAVVLHRDDRTVWTVYQRALRKKARGGGAG